jgi:Raf kinase inhibitor-like YbhB/YbcL family protein
MALSAIATAQEPLPPITELGQPQHAAVSVTGHILEPKQVSPDAGSLELPEGFEVAAFAEDLVNPRMLAVADDGSVYVTRRDVGDVLLLKDTDGDGRADEQVTVASRPGMHGIALAGNDIYLATVNDVYRATRQSDGRLGELERIIDDLPDGGQHPNRTLVWGPDEKLYISVGSTCNACGETNPESATILQAEPDGSTRKIYASGLRNTIGFAFHPDSGKLYGMDHGMDWLGDDRQHEELNLIVEGRKYGWPYIYDDGRINPADEPPKDVTPEEWAEQSASPAGMYVPHSAPMQLAIYTGKQFPEAYRGDAFVAMRGSWNRNPPAGYELVRIDFEDGEPVAFEPFLTGFLTRKDGNWQQSGRLAGLAEAEDGALLLTDDTNGFIWRISYTGDRQAAAAGVGERVAIEAGSAPGAPPAEPGELAADVLQSEEELDVQSEAFASGEPIPPTFAAEQENISPPIRWSEGPAGTQSYVLMMEDPDVRQSPPFVHWVAYNIPASVTELQEGVPGAAKLQLPKGMTQGANDAGSLGYTGMKPPVGDAPHHYNFQVFAVDSMLEVPHGASRAEILAALDGKVLAQGKTVGTFERTSARAQ